jgi:hypothetical protein
LLKPSKVGPLAADSAIMTLFTFPIDFRNSSTPSSVSTCVAQRGISIETLLGLRTTRFFPIAAFISFEKQNDSLIYLCIAKKLEFSFQIFST